MKRFNVYLVFSIAILSLPSFLDAQAPGPKFYDNINTVGKIEATNSDITIRQADKVIVTIDISDKSKLYLDAYQQIKDSTGNYITFLHLIDPDELSSEINLLFKFDKPVIGGNITFPKGASGSSAFNSIYSTDKKMAQFRGTVGSDKGMIVFFKSAEKISINIKGIVGIAKK